jgi:hypothetical protein
MSNSTPTTAVTGEVKKKEFPWIALGVPIGCAIGIAIRNLALGIGVGIILAATLVVFRAKKEGRKTSPVVQIALVIACAAVVALGFIAKR